MMGGNLACRGRRAIGILVSAPIEATACHVSYYICGVPICCGGFGLSYFCTQRCATCTANCEVSDCRPTAIATVATWRGTALGAMATLRCVHSRGSDQRARRIAPSNDNATANQQHVPQSRRVEGLSAA